MSRSNRQSDVERDLLEISDGEGPLALRSAMRETLLATVSQEHRFDGFLARAAALLDLPRERTRLLLREVGRFAESRWEDGRVAGVRIFHFDGGPRIADAHCGIVHIQPDVSYPRHRHRGDEWSLVLQGTAREDTGHIWAPGDLVGNLADSRHSFTALGPEPFVFLVVVNDGIEHE